MLRLSSTFLDELHGLLLTKELSMNRQKKVISSNNVEPFMLYLYKVNHLFFPHRPKHMQYRIHHFRTLFATIRIKDRTIAIIILVALEATLEEISIPMASLAPTTISTLVVHLLVLGHCVKFVAILVMKLLTVLIV
ncbi:hypothetical protein ACFX16_020094 [Malus domestica]